MPCCKPTLWGVTDVALKNYLIGLFLSIAWFASTAYSAATPPTYDVLIQQGKTQLQGGNAGLALDSSRGAIKLSATRWEGYALAGGALMNLKRYEEAADSLSEAIKNAPEAKQPALRNLRRQCLLAQSGSTTANNTSAGATTTSQAEVVLWKSIENSKNLKDFDSYLKQYPSGVFAVLARQHIADITGYLWGMNFGSRMLAVGYPKTLPIDNVILGLDSGLRGLNMSRADMRREYKYSCEALVRAGKPSSGVCKYLDSNDVAPSDSEQAKLIGLTEGVALRMAGFTVENISFDLYKQGFSEALAGKAAVGAAEWQTLTAYLRPVVEANVARNKIIADKFLEEKKKEPNVHITSSGLVYKIIEQGDDGAISAQIDDQVILVIGIKMLDGTEGLLWEQTSPVRDYEKFRQEVVLLMKPGATWEIYLHPDRAYSNLEHPSVSGAPLLIEDMTIKKIIPLDPAVVAVAKNFLEKNGRLPRVTTTASGLQYQINSPGNTNAASPTLSDQVLLQYRCKLIDGSEFDSSYSRGKPSTIKVNAAIRGWQEALVLMKPGAKWRVFIPPELAYGSSPRPGIPAESVLICDAELQSINR
jgi:FKBP-type peptidyl-prolyl cis-trans isomerase